MVPAEQMALITPEDSALERLHRDVRFVSELVADIRDSLPIQRRPLSEWTKSIHIRVTLNRRNGFCPACSVTPVCDIHGKLPGAEFDHFYARHRAGVSETWLTCGSCNRALESTDFKSAVRSAFEAYQMAVRPCLSGQGDLFSRL
jgi:hypothetical protein